MKIVVFGGNGFIGRAVAREMESSGHEVLRGIDTAGKRVDLLNQDAVRRYLQVIKPEVIINCAGVVGGGDFENNIRFTQNIIAGAQHAEILVKRVIITGSAGEYGRVERLPVSETTPLAGTSPYAMSKIQEEKGAFELVKDTDTSVVVARVFNPIGPAMHNKFLVPNLLKQIHAIKNGERDHIEISRLDTKRDYIAVSDIATAFKALTEGSPQYQAYNVGSGVSSTNGQLLDLLLKGSKIGDRPNIVVTMSEPELQVASQADISRIEQEFGWKPVKSLEEVVEEIIDATK